VNGTVSDSLRNINILVSPKKWLSVESESLYEIVWLVCWNISDSVEMRMKWIRITWNIYFAVSWLQYKNSKHFKSIHIWNVSIFPFETAPSDSRLNQKRFTLANEPLVDTIQFSCSVYTSRSFPSCTCNPEDKFLSQYINFWNHQVY
jgi:hypothetical protein